MPAALEPVAAPRPWEIVSELCVIVGLFGTGLRIDRLAGRDQWMPTLRLLVIAMPLCIAAVALVGSTVASMTFAGGLLLGAILAPTDPVLAGDVQVGPPHEGGEHPVRYTLTTEAGLNDGLAFPFVHLGIAVAGTGALTLDLAGDWLVRDVVYRITIGAAAGAAVAIRTCHSPVLRFRCVLCYGSASGSADCNPIDDVAHEPVTGQIQR